MDPAARVTRRSQDITPSRRDAGPARSVHDLRGPATAPTSPSRTPLRLPHTLRPSTGAPDSAREANAAARQHRLRRASPGRAGPAAPARSGYDLRGRPRLRLHRRARRSGSPQALRRAGSTGQRGKQSRRPGNPHVAEHHSDAQGMDGLRRRATTCEIGRGSNSQGITRAHRGCSCCVVGSAHDLRGQATAPTSPPARRSGSPARRDPRGSTGLRAGNRPGSRERPRRRASPGLAVRVVPARSGHDLRGQVTAPTSPAEAPLWRSRTP